MAKKLLGDSLISCDLETVGLHCTFDLAALRLANGQEVCKRPRITETMPT